MRATAYAFGNKSITLGNKTHVVWLDAVAKVCGRTFDHASGRWSDTLELFDGCDNHTNPALTADARGHLHIAWGPHGWWGNWNEGRFKHAISVQANSLLEWTSESDFGYNATYACLVHLPQGLDAIVYRGGESPCSLMFQRQRPEGGWADARPLMSQDIAPQYTHVSGFSTCDASGTLYATGHFYNIAEARSLGAAILRSADLGNTWTDLRGKTTETPIRLSPRFAIPAAGNDPYVIGAIVDSSGSFWTGTYDASGKSGTAYVCRWTGTDWETIDLAPFMPSEYRIVCAVLSIDAADHLHVAATGIAANLNIDKHAAWGHPSLEVFHLCSHDGGKFFECHQVSPPDPTAANWLPNISLPGLFHPVEFPVILYTHGLPGVGCSPTTQTEVWCLRVEEISRR